MTHSTNPFQARPLHLYIRRLIDAWRHRRAMRRQLAILYRMRQDDLKDIGLTSVDIYAVKTGAILTDMSRRQR
jgi:uncharacterized protein YjiS (DUF1127 family)